MQIVNFFEGKPKDGDICLKVCNDKIIQFEYEDSKNVPITGWVVIGAINIRPQYLLALIEALKKECDDARG